MTCVAKSVLLCSSSSRNLSIFFLLKPTLESLQRVIAQRIIAGPIDYQVKFSLLNLHSFELISLFARAILA